MARRHHHLDGDWESLATRLDELLVAHGAEDPFEAGFRLVVAKAWHERHGAGAFLAGEPGAALRALEARVAEAWPGVLDAGIDVPPAALARCAELLRGVDLHAGELAALDAAFEGLTERASRGARGQFFTPRHVVRAVVDMVAPRAGERVLDPACGSGAFLRAAAAAGAEVHGIDLDLRAARVARAMLAAAGLPPGRVVRADALAGPPPGPFDVVVGNPPFAGDVGAAYPDYALSGLGVRVERDVLFLERSLACLRPGGRFALVLPQNKFGGGAFAPVRRWVLTQARVVGVVGLGRNTFLPHTAQKACVILGVRRPAPLAAPAADEALTFFVSAVEAKDPGGRLVRDAGGAVLHDLDEAVPPLRAAFAEAGA